MKEINEEHSVNLELENIESGDTIWRSSCMGSELYEAALQGCVEDIKRYLQKMQQRQPLEDCNSSPIGYALPLTPTGNSVLHVHLAATFDSRQASVAFIQFILDQDESLLWHKNDDGEIPLHLAARFGQKEAVQVFVERAMGDNAVAEANELPMTKDKEGDTALHMAVRNKHFPVARYLLNFASLEHIQKYNTCNNAGETPLHLAVGCGSKELLEIVLTKVMTPRCDDTWKESALHAAVLWGDLDTVRMLMNRFPELINAQDHKGQTPLHYATGMDNKMLQILLLEYDSSLAAYTQDKEGRSAGHIAVQQNNVKGLRLLMDCFPDSLELVDSNGLNVVHYAASLGYRETLIFLLSSIRSRHLVNKRDKDGDTPLHKLAASLKDIEPMPLRYICRVMDLITMKLRLKVFNNKNLTAGDIARSHNILEFPLVYERLKRKVELVAPRGGRTKEWLPSLKSQKSAMGANPGGYTPKAIRQIARDHAIVAGLITTVSFTAGLTVPGGFDQGTGEAMFSKPQPGGRHNFPFDVFLISDTLALTASFIAIVSYFLIACPALRGWTLWLIFLASLSNCFSMVALMAAFMSGAYSILSHSKHVSFYLVCIASAFIVMALVLFSGVLAFYHFQNRQRKFLRQKVLYGEDNQDDAGSIPFPSML